MGLGVSFLLIAAGAILAWAVNADVSGVNIHAVGWILLIVGIVGRGALDDLLVVVGRARLLESPPGSVRRRRPSALLDRERRTPERQSRRSGAGKLRVHTRAAAVARAFAPFN